MTPGHKGFKPREVDSECLLGEKTSFGAVHSAQANEYCTSRPTCCRLGLFHFILYRGGSQTSTPFCSNQTPRPTELEAALQYNPVPCWPTSPHIWKLRVEDTPIGDSNRIFAREFLAGVSMYRGGGCGGGGRACPEPTNQ